MKKLIAIILFFTISMAVKAQEQSSNWTYIKQSDLNKFEGRWIYTNGPAKFILNLRKEKVMIKGKKNKVSIELIQGDYSLLNNGKIVYSSAKEDQAIKSGGFHDKNKSLNKIEFIFTDLGRNSKRCHVFLEFLNDDTKKLRWVLTNTEHVLVGDQTFDPTFSVPELMTLRKVD